MMLTYYDILQIEPTATAAQVRAAYRQWMKRLHPDTGAQPPADQLQQIMTAYQVLSDPRKRQRYDQSLGLSLPGNPQLSPIRAALLQALSWFSVKNDTSEAPPSVSPPRRKKPTRQKDPDFAHKLSQAQAQTTQPAFVRGADGVYRRTTPQDEILADIRPVRRPLSNRPAPLQKPGSWKLWR